MSKKPRLMSSNKLKINPVIGTDECGCPTAFTLPHAALYYDTGQVSYREEEKVRRRVDDLCDKAYARQDQDEVLIFNCDDKVDVIHRVKSCGRWIE